MDRMTLHVGHTPDGESVRLETVKDGKVVGRIVFDATSTDQCVRNIAKHRAALTDPVAPSLDPGARLQPVADAAWSVLPGRDGKVVVAMRDPGLGWCSFSVDPIEAKAMAKRLEKLAEDAVAAS
jgi:hypothetical protein